MKQYSSRIYYMEGDAVTDQPYIFYIRGSRFSLLVDAGNSRENYHRLLHELNQEHLPAPSLIALTHWHWDHTFGLCAADCPAIASELTNRQLKSVRTWSLDEESMKHCLETGEDIQFCYDGMHAQYRNMSDVRVRTADITFSHSMTIDLGGLTCHLEQRDTPHCRDAVLIHIPEEKVLIGGDAQYADDYCNNGEYDRTRLREFIDYLKSLEFKDYLKGHDSPVISREDLIAELETALENAKEQ